MFTLNCKTEREEFKVSFDHQQHKWAQFVQNLKDENDNLKKENEKV